MTVIDKHLQRGGSCLSEGSIKAFDQRNEENY
jgi:hypothetical protein